MMSLANLDGDGILDAFIINKIHSITEPKDPLGPIGPAPGGETPAGTKREHIKYT